MSFFHYDLSRQSLVFPDAQTGKPVAIHVNQLRAMGYEIDEAVLRKTLPRFDPPLIHGVRR